MQIIDNPLMNQLNSMISETQLDNVKRIVSALININNFKSSTSDSPNMDFLYTQISKFLKQEFSIEHFKIIETINNIETAQYQAGDESFFSHSFCKTVNVGTTITFLLDNSSLNDFNKVYLNCFLTETSSILYIQFVLLALAQSSHIDSLTQLKNRLSFQEDMKGLIPLILREKMNIGILLINIDRFRAANDEHGTNFGDEFLKLYANTIKDTIRTSDIAIRFSGGEFLVLLINVINEEKTNQIANNLKDKLSSVYLKSPNGDNFKKTVCIGT